MATSRTSASGTRRVAGIGLAIVGLVLAVTGVAGRLEHRPGGDVDLGRSAANAEARSTEALSLEARNLEASATGAARVPELAAAVNMGADRRTYEDLLENEEWWAPYRAQFQFTALAIGDLVARQGVGPARLDQAPAVTAARNHGTGSGVLTQSGGPPLLAAAARIADVNVGSAPAIVLVGTPIDAQRARSARVRAWGTDRGVRRRSLCRRGGGAGKSRGEPGLAGWKGDPGPNPTR